MGALGQLAVAKKHDGAETFGAQSRVFFEKLQSLFDAAGIDTNAVVDTILRHEEINLPDLTDAQVDEIVSAIRDSGIPTNVLPAV